MNRNSKSLKSDWRNVGLAKVYEQLQNGETLRVAFGEYKNYSSKKAYESFLQKIGQTEPEVIKKPRTFRVWWSVAAAVVF